MSQSGHKDKPNSTTKLENITNTQPRQTRQRCVVKMQKLEATASTKPTVIKKSTRSQSQKRKIKKSDEVSVAKKKKNEQTTTAVTPSVDTPTTTTPCVENLVKKYEQLQKVISQKYVTVVDRLKLNHVPFCCENLEFCHQTHYKHAPAPKTPSFNQMNLIQNSIQQDRYNVFIGLVWGLCHRGEFPGDKVLTNIVKLLLTLNPQQKYNAFLQNIIDQLVSLFDVILKKFPPCWLALRDSYIKFLRNTMEISQLLPDKALNSENTVFEIVLMLLEDNLSEAENSKINRSAKRRRGASSSASTSSTLFNNYDNEYHNMQQWEKHDNNEHTFTALSKTARTERLMIVLHFLAKMLEMDMAMWMLRHHKNPAKHMYNIQDHLLVIELFTLSEYKSSSVLVKRVMSLFSLCVEQDLNENYINIMDRFISLLGNVQNLSETVGTSWGVRYPIVGPRTSTFALDLYKTAEVNMKTSISAYMRLIKNLSCPFVRFEYIDLFLKRMNPAPGKMNPQKIFDNFRRNRWLECNVDEERSLDESFFRQKSIVYRRDYLKLILEALRSYCEYFALKEFFQEIFTSTKDNTDGDNVTVQNQQNSEEFDQSNLGQIDLSTMAKNIVELEKNLDMSVKLRVARTEIPTLNIDVNAELMAQYRNDLKYVINLHSYISVLQQEHDQDFSELIEFLKDFAPSK